MNKKIIVIILALCLTAAGVFALIKAGIFSPAPAPEPTPEIVETPTPAPTPNPEPETTAAYVTVLKAPAILAVLNYGDEVNITGENGGYYIVSTPLGCGYVQKELIALASDPVYERWTGYAANSAGLYDDYRLFGAPLETLDLNTPLTVIAQLGNCYLVDYKGTRAYIAADSVSETEISYSYSYYSAPAPSSGDEQPAPAPAPSEPVVPGDGGDIVLGYRVQPGAELIRLADIVPQDSELTRKGRIIALRAEVIAAFYELDEEVRVLSSIEEMCTLYIDGITAMMERRFLLLDGEEPFVCRDMETVGTVPVFNNYYLCGDADIYLSPNTEVKVIADLGNCCLIIAGETRGYVSPDQLREPVQTAQYSGYSSYTQPSGGSGSTPPAAPDPAPAPGGSGEWTEPVL